MNNPQKCNQSFSYFLLYTDHTTLPQCEKTTKMWNYFLFAIFVFFNPAPGLESALDRASNALFGGWIVLTSGHPFGGRSDYQQLPFTSGQIRISANQESEIFDTHFRMALAEASSYIRRPASNLFPFSLEQLKRVLDTGAMQGDLRANNTCGIVQGMRGSPPFAGRQVCRRGDPCLH